MQIRKFSNVKKLIKDSKPKVSNTQSIFTQQQQNQKQNEKVYDFAQQDRVYKSIQEKYQQYLAIIHRYETWEIHAYGTTNIFFPNILLGNINAGLGFVRHFTIKNLSPNVLPLIGIGFDADYTSVYTVNGLITLDILTPNITGKFSLVFFNLSFLRPFIALSVGPGYLLIRTNHLNSPLKSGILASINPYMGLSLLAYTKGRWYIGIDVSYKLQIIVYSSGLLMTHLLQISARVDLIHNYRETRKKRKRDHSAKF